MQPRLMMEAAHERATVHDPREVGEMLAHEQAGNGRGNDAELATYGVRGEWLGVEGFEVAGAPYWNTRMHERSGARPGRGEATPPRAMPAANVPAVTPPTARKPVVSPRLNAAADHAPAERRRSRRDGDVEGMQGLDVNTRSTQRLLFMDGMSGSRRVTRASVVPPSRNAGLLRGCCSGIAERGGFGLRPVFGGEKWCRKTLRGGAKRKKQRKTVAKTVRNPMSVSGCCCARRERRSHVLKIRNVGNSRVKKFARGSKVVFRGARETAGARRCSTSVEIQVRGYRVRNEEGFWGM